MTAGTTTTAPETITTTLAAHDLRALRNADAIVFRFWQEQGTIEAIKRAERTSDGFEGKHYVYTGTSFVDYGRDTSHVPADQRHTLTCFHMESSADFSATTKTLISRLAVGDRVTLKWTRSNQTPLLTDAGLVCDQLHVQITKRTGKVETYLFASQVGHDNSARMVKRG